MATDGERKSIEMVAEACEQWARVEAKTRDVLKSAPNRSVVVRSLYAAVYYSCTAARRAWRGRAPIPIREWKTGAGPETWIRVPSSKVAKTMHWDVGTRRTIVGRVAMRQRLL